MLAVGSIQPSNVANISLEDPLLFVGGMIEGLVGDNNLTEIQSCFTDADQVLNDLEKIVQAIDDQKWIRAGMDV